MRDYTAELLAKYEALLSALRAMSLEERKAFVYQYNRLTPEQQAQAMINAGPEGEEAGRAFEDMKQGGPQ